MMIKKPWESEPDSVDFEAEGLPCCMRRGLGGMWCGYVGIPPSHPWFGLPYNTKIKPSPDMLKDRGLHNMGVINLFLAAVRDDNPENEMEICTALAVHGGITWCGELPNEHHQGFYWYGFDCGHAGDLVPGMLGMKIGEAMRDFMTPEQAEHFEKVIKPILARAPKDVYRDQQFVVSECQSLAAQLAEVARAFGKTERVEEKTKEG